jgi:hypothetical protein
VRVARLTAAVAARRRIEPPPIVVAAHPLTDRKALRKLDKYSNINAG